MNRILWSFLLLNGLLLVVAGYHLLAVPPEAGYDEMLRRAWEGMFSVAGGGGLLMVWVAKR